MQTQNKKDLQFLESLIVISGEDETRTHDLLTASQVLYYLLNIHSLPIPYVKP